MPTYTIQVRIPIHTALDGDVNGRAKRFLKGVKPILQEYHHGESCDMQVDDTALWFDAALSVQAPYLREALSQARYTIGCNAIICGWSGWYPADVIAYGNRVIERKFTPAEAANPDVILTSVPAESTLTAIRAARKRHRALRRVQLAVQFAQANPGLVFDNTVFDRRGTPRMMGRGGCVTRLCVSTYGNKQLPVPLSVTTSAVRNRIRLVAGHPEERLIDERIEPTDSQRVQVVLEHLRLQPAHPIVYTTASGVVTLQQQPSLIAPL